jgi:hypothetical protein
MTGERPAAYMSRSVRLGRQWTSSFSHTMNSVLSDFVHPTGKIVMRVTGAVAVYAPFDMFEYLNVSCRSKAFSANRIRD